MTTKSAEDINLGSDVQVIREILFGQQAKQFQERIAALEQALAALRDENRQLHEALEQKLQQGLSAEQQAREDEHRAGTDRLTQQIETEAKCRAESLAELEKNLTALIEKVRDQMEEQHKQQLTDQAALLGGLLETLQAYRQKVTLK